jgi:hypothetical protein
MNQKARRWIAVTSVCGILGALAIGGFVRAYEVDPAAPGVTVSGRVTYVGTLPLAERLAVDRDRAFCGETILDEALQVDQESRGVAGVIVSLEGVLKGKTVPEDRAVTIENRTCRFFPRVSAVAAGAQLVISNADPIMHNTHIRKKSRFGDNLLNVVQPPQGKVEKPLKEVGLLDVRCDAHPFMAATIHVFDHPYFVVTDRFGQYQLPQVPPGKYKLKMWHETLRKQERMISVPSEGQVTINLEVGPGV